MIFAIPWSFGGVDLADWSYGYDVNGTLVGGSWLTEFVNYEYYYNMDNPFYL